MLTTCIYSSPILSVVGRCVSSLSSVLCTVLGSESALIDKTASELVIPFLTFLLDIHSSYSKLIVARDMATLMSRTENEMHHLQRALTICSVFVQVFGPQILVIKSLVTALTGMVSFADVIGDTDQPPACLIRIRSVALQALGLVWSSVPSSSIVDIFRTIRACLMSPLGVIKTYNTTNSPDSVTSPLPPKAPRCHDDDVSSDIIMACMTGPLEALIGEARNKSKSSG